MPTDPPGADPIDAAARRRPWARLLSGVDPAPAVASVVAMAMLVVSHHQGSTGFFREHLAALVQASPFADVYPYLYWYGASVAFYLGLPLLACALTPGLRVRDTGVGLGDWRFGLAAAGAILAVFLPVVWVASRVPAFAGHYPLCAAARLSWRAFVLYEAGYVAYFVAWEYLFRGYLLFAFERPLGKLAAFAQMMPFVVAHFGKPEAESLGAIVAGVVLGLMALRTRSFWYGAAIHAAVAVSMDLFVSIAQPGASR